MEQAAAPRLEKVPLWQGGLVVGVALLAVALGGTTSREAQAVVLALIGAGALVRPPRVLPGGGLPVLLALFWLWGWSGFLPVWLQGDPEWRRLLEALGLETGALVSPQPVITLEAMALLSAGLLWLLWVAPVFGEAHRRLSLLRLYLLGASLLALVAIGSWWGGVLFQGSEEQPIFGFFPNRNQMADWLAGTGVLAFGLFWEQIRHGKGKARWPLLEVATWSVMLVGLLLAGSRAGVGLFFVGMFFFGAYWWRLLRGGARLPWMMAGSSVGVIGLAIFFLYGGSILERMSLGGTPSSGGAMDAFARLELQAAGFRQAADMPLTGVGLGNFDVAYPFYRDRLVNESRGLHPESDWAWLAGELGWPGVVLAALALVVALRLVWPFDRRTHRLPRLAALTATVVFILHSFLDVGAHRLGTWLPAAMLLTAAWRPACLCPATGWKVGVMRALGAGLLAVALWWGAMLGGWISPWGWIASQRAVNAAETQAGRGNWAAVEPSAREVLAVQPLDWYGHLLLGMGQARQGNQEAATTSFLVSRRLEPDSPFPVEQEAQTWLAVGDAGRAASAFNAYLERSLIAPESRFDSVAVRLRRAPGGERHVLALATGRPLYWNRYLRRASPEQLARALRLMEGQPSLEEGLQEPDREVILDRMAASMGLAATLDWVAAHPTWEEASTWLQARQAAQKEHWSEAVLLGRKAVAVPVIPGMPPVAKADAVEAQLVLRAGPLGDYLQVVAAYEEAGRDEDALRVLTMALHAHPDAPAYLRYRQMQLRESIRDYQGAWQALELYRKER